MSSVFAKIPSVNDLLDSLSDQQAYIDPVYLKKLIDNTINDIKNHPDRYNLDKENRAGISDKIGQKVRAEVKKLFSPSLHRVINASGVILHTGLGRAPLGDDALVQLEQLAHYTNLEIQLNTGRRGERLDHVAPVLSLLTGSDDAVVVNNNAAAVLLMLNTIARRKEVIVSRGELVEIGGSFRMPEVMKTSGAKMVEIGATNKTHLNDYAEAITEKTAAIMLVHPSNYKIVGFTDKPELKEIIDLAHQHNIPVIFDLGSGAFVNMEQYGFEYEPVVQDMIDLGIDLISFSGDKLLGGPQAGIIVGRTDLIKKIRKNHLLRALRCDKIQLSILSSVLQNYLKPAQLNKKNMTLQLFNRDLPFLTKLAQKILSATQSAKSFRTEIVPAQGKVGSGAYPVAHIDSVAIKINSPSLSAEKLARKFRLNPIPIFGYIENDTFFLNMLTVLEKDIPDIIFALNTI